MYDLVYWDISGVCNASCPYCCNGKQSISGFEHKRKSSMIDPAAYVDAVRYLETNGQIHPNRTLLGLFNWGEPFLHPHLGDILEATVDLGYKFQLSTNGSKLHTFSEKSLSKLEMLTFSMPGFSQASYDRIHGFQFQEILANILTMIRQMLLSGYRGKFIVAYHVYQFSAFEVQVAREFFAPLPVAFSPILAYFNGSSMGFDYLAGTMKPEVLAKATSELFTYQYRDIRRPEGYRCPQYDYLTLDENLNVLLCCGMDKATEGYSLGNLYQIDFRDFRTRREASPTCAKCAKLGFDFIGHNPISV